ncbi:MAG: hypothetical protein RSD59_06900, partial [Lactococcus sp.]
RIRFFSVYEYAIWSPRKVNRARLQNGLRRNYAGRYGHHFLQMLQFSVVLKRLPIFLNLKNIGKRLILFFILI